MPASRKFHLVFIGFQIFHTLAPNCSQNAFKIYCKVLYNVLQSLIIEQVGQTDTQKMTHYRQNTTLGSSVMTVASVHLSHFILGQ